MRQGRSRVPQLRPDAAKTKLFFKKCKDLEVRPPWMRVVLNSMTSVLRKRKTDPQRSPVKTETGGKWPKVWTPGDPAQLSLYCSHQTKERLFPEMWNGLRWRLAGCGVSWGAGCGEQEGMERGQLRCVTILHAPPPPSGPGAWTQHLLFTVLATPSSGLTYTHTCRDTVGHV